MEAYFTKNAWYKIKFKLYNDIKPFIVDLDGILYSLPIENFAVFFTQNTQYALIAFKII